MSEHFNSQMYSLSPDNSEIDPVKQMLALLSLLVNNSKQQLPLKPHKPTTVCRKKLAKLYVIFFVTYVSKF